MLSDEHYMRRCLALACKAEGRTSPNPLVGALVVADDGTIIAEGFHQKAGESHAEVIALDRAGERARGQTLFVNLEPCCHFGKTPPCSNRVIQSGVKRTVFGILDPNPKVQGGGLKSLQDAGIEVRYNVLVDECRYVNRGFLRCIEHGRPWLTLKMAATIDGRIADRSGTSRWITGEPARRFVHQLRNLCDCVMVGGKTVVRDDPELTVQDVPGSRNPRRVVVDTNLLLAPQSKLCLTESGSTFVYASEAAASRKRQMFPSRVHIVDTPCTPEGHLDLAWVLRHLATHGVRTVLCEGGSRLAGALFEYDLVDELVWIIAPKLLMDKEAIAAVAAPHTVHLPEAKTLLTVESKTLGDDIFIRGLLHQP